MGLSLWRWIGCALLLAAPANAQYVASSSSGVPYPTLTAPVPITLTAASGTASDKGRATLGLGFTFPFYDKQYTSITVTANGVAFFEPSSAAFASADFSANSAVSTVSEPNAVLAPLWDDLDGRNPSSALQYQPLSGPNGQGLVIEWSRWSYWTGSYDMTFQVRLWENGLIDFFYGSIIGSGSSLSATVGIEGPDGSAGTEGRACGSLCRLADLQSNARISFGPPTGVDLMVRRVKVNSVVASGPNLQIATSVDLRNFGTAASGAFTYRLYLSNNTTFEPGVDIPLGAAQGPLTLGAMSNLEHTATNSVPRPSSGSYYVIAVVDDAAAITETNEVNNVGANPSALGPGVDLLAQAITGPPVGGPGETISVNVEFSNIGLDSAGTVPFDVWLSADATLGLGDVKVYSSSLSMAGGQNINQAVAFPLPSTVPAGSYYFLLQLDHGPAAGLVTESDDGNNVKASTTLFAARQADLVVDSVSVLEPAPPNPPAAVAFFGETIRVQATVRNAGAATGNNVAVRFYLSDNDTLNGFSDPLLGEVPGLTLAPGASQTVALNVPVPSAAVGGVPYMPGSYYFFAAAVAPNLIEANGQNNRLSSDPQRLANPAPDLVPLSILGPSRVGAGEAFSVQRAFGNRGNRPAANVPYRYYLSANTLITPDDLPLKMVTPGGLVDEKRFSLAVGQRDVGTDTVIVPEDAPESTYYLGVLVDPPLADRQGEVREVDEDNNGFAVATVDVAAVALGLGPAPLPDALLGQPYDVQLGARGGDGNYLFAVGPRGGLPAGMTLSSSGRITGVPSAVGVTACEIAVTSAGRTVLVHRVLRVLSPTPALTIVTTRLPSVARGTTYEAGLAAVGGVAPYTWVLEAGGLPAGLALEADGKISGISTAPLGTETMPIIGVRDAVGNHASALLPMTVGDVSALRLVASTLANATLGEAFAADLAVENVNKMPIVRPVTWRVVQGALPSGLMLEPQDERALIAGTPLETGLFVFTLEATDANGRSDSADFLLRVFPSAFVMHAAFPSAVARGEAVDVTLALDPMAEGASFAIYAGALPPGLSLDAAGTVSGTVDSEAPFGVYTFTIAGGLRGSPDVVGAWAIEVSEDAGRGRGRCGCGTFPGSAIFAAMWVGVFLGRKRCKPRIL